MFIPQDLRDHTFVSFTHKYLSQKQQPRANRKRTQTQKEIRSFQQHTYLKKSKREKEIKYHTLVLSR